MLPQNRSIVGNDNRYIIKNPDVVPYRFFVDVRMVFPNGKTFAGTAINVSILSSTAKTLSYKIDTKGGQSGAWIYNKNANNSFLSVRIYGYGGNTSNSGRRIDKLLFNWLSKFK